LGHLDISILALHATGYPRWTLSRRTLLHHIINLFKAQSLCLVDAEVSEEDASRAGASPNEEHLLPQVALIFVDDIGSNERNDEVPKPIGSSG